MNRSLVAALVAVVLGTIACGPVVRAQEAPPRVERKPAVAGFFYPAEAARLERAVREFLRDAEPSRGVRPLALVAPHAGYLYSGQIAGDAWRQAQGHDYELIVLLGTNHTTARFEKVSIFPGRGYRTPLGLAEIDQEVAAALKAADPVFTSEVRVHTREHSVEVHVPFVQVLFPEAKILPAVVGSPDPELCARAGRALAKVLTGRKVLLVASSDLSHYPAYDDAVAADRQVLEALATLDEQALGKTLRQEVARRKPGLSTCMCGEAPVRTLLAAARGLGATRGIVVSYANSGDAPVGDRSRVVGYGAVVLATGAAEPGDGACPVALAPSADKPLLPADHRTLLVHARASIRRFLETGTAPLARDLSPALSRRQGAFVTLHEEGQLRGCIGYQREDTPLGQVVGAMALQAAFNDRRFPPVRAEELAKIEIEISILSPLAPLPRVEDLVIGRDGVVIRKAGRSAVFLPQVATEQGWDREQLLENLCRKAGLARDAWREGAEFFVFQAHVVREADS